MSIGGPIAEILALPPPHLPREATLAHALEMRRSSREFSGRPLDPATLSGLLWAAWGMNRPATRHRTAPSARNWQEIDLYVVNADGAYLYAPDPPRLKLVSEGDHRAATGLQEFVAGVPVNLVYVADFTRMADASSEDRALYAAIDAGLIAQNVYLYCAATGLACVLRGLVDRERLAPLLHLGSGQRVIVAQSVGHPAAP